MGHNSPDKDYFKNPPQSFWLTSTESPQYPSLEKDLKVDVAIVGGGMVGITSAYLLKKEGLRVAVIEADRILQGTTGHTTAKLTSQHNLIYDKLISQFGQERAQQYAQANETAIHTVEKIIKEKNIDCDFSWQPAYVYTQSEQYEQKIMDEVKAASSLGISAYYVNNISIPLKIKGSVRFDNQAQFHPRKYLLALAKEVEGDGSYIFERTKALDIEEGTPCTVITNGHRKIKAAQVIIASHFPFYDARGFYFARIYTERSYVLGAKIKEHFNGGMYINAESPTRSLRYHEFEGGQLILVGGENHKTAHGEPEAVHYQNLRDFAEQTFTLEDTPYRWSTQDCMTMDGIPYVGHLTSNTPNIYIATGFGKWGMTNSTVSAMIIKDLITKGENPWSDIYSPSRFNLAASAANFVKQNADVAVNFVSGKLSPAPDQPPTEKRQAKVYEYKGRRVGGYMDQEGVLHVTDNTCTHLGCELKWNDAELSWDCPCHGSRFTYKGEIAEGPALKSLHYEEIRS